MLPYTWHPAPSYPMDKRTSCCSRETRRLSGQADEENDFPRLVGEEGKGGKGGAKRGKWEVAMAHR